MTRLISTTIFCLMLFSAKSQSVDYNTKNGYAAEGYDVISYFNDKPQKGSGQFETAYNGVKFKFANQNNLKLFMEAPVQYIPQYGGWCAYAMAVQNKKVSINPQTYEIRDGKLYLFYNGILGNSLDKWLSEGPEQLIPMADVNWDKMQDK